MKLEIIAEHCTSAENPAAVQLKNIVFNYAAP